MNSTILQNIGIFRDYYDNTLKNVFKKLDNDEIIEMTLVQNKAKSDVFCVPTHHFCSLGCKMCHLTNDKLEKRMIPIDYPSFFEALIKTSYKGNYYPANYLLDSEKRRTSKPNCLISFMGVGEPSLNLKLIRDVFEHEADIKQATGYKQIGYAMATIFPYDDISGLCSLIDIGMPLKLHFSLHSPLSDERASLLPGTSVTVDKALSLLCEYRSQMEKKPEVMHRFSELHQVMDPVEIHYTLIEGINDSEVHLSELIRLLKEYPIQLKFILFNPIADMRRSPNLDMWLSKIKETVPQINVVAYEPPGREIGSSCGEFTRHYYHYKIESDEEYEEFKQWERKHAFDEHWKSEQ